MGCLSIPTIQFCGYKGDHVQKVVVSPLLKTTLLPPQLACSGGYSVPGRNHQDWAPAAPSGIHRGHFKFQHGGSNNKFLMIQQNQFYLDDLVSWLNQARQNPQSLIPYLQTHLNNFRNEFQLEISPGCFYKTHQGKNAWVEALNFLTTQKPLKPLQRHTGLNKAAEDHAKDLAKNEAMGSVGSDGSTTMMRVQRYCKLGQAIIGQTVAQEFKKKQRNHSVETVLSLIISDGNQDRSDRKSLFNPDFSYFGASIESSPFRFLTVITYSNQNLESQPEGYTNVKRMPVKKTVSLPNTGSENNKNNGNEVLQFNQKREAIF